MDSFPYRGTRTRLSNAAHAKPYCRYDTIGRSDTACFKTPTDTDNRPAHAAATPSFQADSNAQVAPGPPGDAPFWSYSGKTGIGTSYEQYKNGHYSSDAATGAVSKVWFSLANGILTETMFGLIHEAQHKQLQLVIQGPDFVDVEQKDIESEISYLSVDNEGRPNSLAYRITNFRSKNPNVYLTPTCTLIPPSTTAAAGIALSPNNRRSRSRAGHHPSRQGEPRAGSCSYCRLCRYLRWPERSS